MKADAYTKAVLTVIAAAMSALAVEQISVPRAHADPAGDNRKFADIEYQYGGGTITFFDKSTGDLWYYGAFGSDQPPQHEKLVKLGDALVK
jgi:hypothetical protein